MARIETYVKDNTLSDKDKVIGSNYINTVLGVDQFKTNNFTLKQISDYVGNNISTASVNLKPNGGIVYETIDNVQNLAIDLGASNITGALANSDLVNSSITINGVAISLGGSVTTPDTNTQLSTEQVQDIVGAMFSSNTETRIAASYQDSDGTIDLVVDDMTANTQLTTEEVQDIVGGMVSGNTENNIAVTYDDSSGKLNFDSTDTDTNTQLTTEQVQDIVGGMVSSNTETNISVTYDDTGGKLNFVSTDTNTDTNNYVTGASVSGTTSKTLTLTRQGLADLTANWTDIDTVYSLPLATSSDRGGVKIGYSENGKNYPVELDNEKMFVNVPWTDNDTTTVVNDSTANTDFPVVFHDESNGLLDDTGTLTYNPNNAALKVDGLTIDGVSMSGTNIIINSDLLRLGAESSSENYLQGTANGSVILYHDGNIRLETESTGVQVNGKIKVADTSGSIKFQFPDTAPGNGAILKKTNAGGNVLQWVAETDTVYTHPTHDGDDIDIDTGALTSATVISDLDFNITTDTLGHVTDANGTVATRTLTLSDLGYTGATNANNYSLPLAANGTRGGIQVGYTESGKNYPVELDSEKAYVNVPWTDTTYTLPTAAANTLGGVKVGSNLTIDGSGVLNVGAIALTTVQTAANESAHLALTTQEGDVVVRTDQNKSYIKNSGTAGNMNDFTELLSPTDAVTSVKTTDGTYIDLAPNTPTTGAINITADLSAVNGTSDTTTRFLSKDNTWDVPSYTTETYTQHDNISAASSVDNSGRTYIQDITLDSNGHVTGITSATETVVNTDTNTNQLTEWTLRDDDNDDVTIDHNTFVKFISATGASGTNITGAGTTGDPYVVTITSPDSTIANTFRTVQADGSSIGATETLNLIGGTNVTLSESGGAITISSTDTNTDTDTIDMGDGFKIANAAGTDQFTVTENEKIRFEADGATSITFDSATQKIKFTSTDTNTDTNTQNVFTSSFVDSSDDIILRLTKSGASTGTQDININAGANITLTHTDANNITIASTDTNTDTNTNILSGGTITGDVTVNGDMTFEDGHKLELGTGADLDLYHTSNNSYIDNNTGNLYIRCNPSGEIHLRPKESENGVIVRNDGKTELYFDDAKKLETVTGGVTVTGTLTASGDVIAYSDERLKSDIKTLDGSKVYDMRGVSFIKDNKQSSGVIAQELEKIAPELVNNEGEYKAVAYGNVVGYLIEAIKDLKEEVKQLKACTCNGGTE